MMNRNLLALMTMLVAFESASQDAPAGGGLGAMAASGVKGPVVVIDIVKFKKGGESEYDIYDGIAEKKLTSLGGEVVFRGRGAKVEGLSSGDWDRVTFRKYPTVQAVLQMGGSKEYQGAFPHRMASVSESYVYAFSGELASLADPMKVVAAPEPAGAVYVLNLVRFKGEEGEAAYFGQYGSKALPLITALGGGMEANMKGLGAVIAPESLDQMMLIRFPSAAALANMFTSSEYEALVPIRKNALESSHEWFFTHIGEKE